MVCEKMLFLFLLGTFVTVLFCHFPFDCTFSGYSTQWSVGIEGLEVWNVSVGGARGPAEPAGPAGSSPRARGPARARGVFGLVGDLSHSFNRACTTEPQRAKECLLALFSPVLQSDL